MQQIITEGASSPADLFVTVDAGNLWKAFHKFPASTVTNKSAGELAPSVIICCINALPLPDITFTLMPVSAVNLAYNCSSES